MQIKLNKKNQVINCSIPLPDIVDMLADGEYIVSVDMVNPLTTVRQLQKAYFDLVDQVAKDTGNGRYTIHDAYKAYHDMDTTKGLTIDEWRKFLKDFPFWVFSTIGIMV